MAKHLEVHWEGSIIWRTGLSAGNWKLLIDSTGWQQWTLRKCSSPSSSSSVSLLAPRLSMVVTVDCMKYYNINNQLMRVCRRISKPRGRFYPMRQGWHRTYTAWGPLGAVIGWCRLMRRMIRCRDDVDTRRKTVLPEHCDNRADTTRGSQSTKFKKKKWRRRRGNKGGRAGRGRLHFGDSRR